MRQHLLAGGTTSCGCALADLNKVRASAPDYQDQHPRLVAARKPKPKGVVRKITFNGKTQGLQDWARELGVNYQLIQYRLDNKWSVAKALSTPSRKVGQR